MSSCTECHGMAGLHTSNHCPRVTGARLYTPQEIADIEAAAFKRGAYKARDIALKHIEKLGKKKMVSKEWFFEVTKS